MCIQGVYLAPLRVSGTWHGCNCPKSLASQGHMHELRLRTHLILQTGRCNPSPGLPLMVTHLSIRASFRKRLVLNSDCCESRLGIPLNGSSQIQDSSISCVSISYDRDVHSITDRPVENRGQVNCPRQKSDFLFKTKVRCPVQDRGQMYVLHFAT